MGNFYRVIYGLVSALALSLPAYGADAQFATWGGAVLEGGSAPTNGWSRQYNIEKRVGSKTTVVTRSLPLNLSGYADVLNYSKRSVGASVAIAGAVAGAGWAIDELRGQITKTPENSGQVDPNGYFYQVVSSRHHGDALPTPKKALDSWCAVYTPASSCSVVSDTEGEYYVGEYRNTISITKSGCSTNEQWFYEQFAPLAGCLVPEFEDVPFSDVLDLINTVLKTLPSSAIKDMFWDSTTDQPYMDPGVQDLLDDVKDEAQREEDEEPQECPAGQKLENDQCVPEETECPSGQVKNAQGQCEDDNPCKDLGKNYVYNSEAKSCDYDEPEHPEIDVESIGKVDFDSGLGDGSCPAPIVEPMPLGGQVVYDFETPCDITTYLVKPALLIGASILAAFTVVGRLG